jgi:hypothetical protein
MCQSLNASVEVGRIGTRKHVAIVLDETSGLISITVEGKLVRLVPITNIVDFTPIAEPIVEPVVEKAKK